MASMCLDDACTIQFTGLSVPSHIAKHTAPFHGTIHKAEERPNSLPCLKREGVSHLPHLTSRIPESQRNSMAARLLMLFNLVPFAILNSLNPLRLGSELGVGTACRTMHHAIFVFKPRAARLPRSVEWPLLSTGFCDLLRCGPSTGEASTIIYARDMHIAFTSHALLSVSVP